MSLLRDAGIQFASGGCAGLVEVSLMHPLDLIKTRFQVQGGPGDPQHYKGLADCFRSIYRTEGFLSFYKGILPPILAETPKRATKFFTFEQYKKAFTCDEISMPVVLKTIPALIGPIWNSTNGYSRGISPELLLIMTFALAGLGSGLTEAFVICPFEVVKVRLQSERGLSIKDQKGSFQLAREIIKAGGLGTQGIYRGITATLGRHGVWNMVYFGLYHSVKQHRPPPQDPSMNLLYRFVVGLTAGTVASVVNIPFDVAKSRIQGPQPVPGQRKYHGCFQSMSLVAKEEGFLALYKGLLPKMMRLGPGGAIMLIVYEHAHEFLQEHIP